MSAFLLFTFQLYYGGAYNVLIPVKNFIFQERTLFDGKELYFMRTEVGQ